MIISILSGKGGTGKTTLTASIAVTLAEKGSKVAAVDVDAGLGNLCLNLGVLEKTVFCLDDYFNGTELDKILIPYSENLMLLPASNKIKYYSEPNYDRLFNELSESFEYILIDCPAGIGNTVLNAAKCSDMVIIVTNTDISAVKDAEIKSTAINEFTDNVFLVVNRVSKKLINSGSSGNIDDIMDTLATRLIGYVFEDNQIIISGNKSIPAVKSKRFKQKPNIEKIASRICDLRREI